MNNDKRNDDLKRDPLSGPFDKQLVVTGIGAVAGGAAAGIATRTVAGPVRHASSGANSSN